MCLQFRLWLSKTRQIKFKKHKLQSPIFWNRSWRILGISVLDSFRLRRDHHLLSLIFVGILSSPPDEDASNVQIMCAWCQKVGNKRYSLSMGSELKSFCSEKCFAACRRAYFKRNKVKTNSLSAGPLFLLGGSESQEHWTIMHCFFQGKTAQCGFIVCWIMDVLVFKHYLCLQFLFNKYI